MEVVEEILSGICCEIQIDQERLAVDLSTMAKFAYTNTYGEFSCGEWRSVAMWNGTGNGLDASLDPYQGPPLLTDMGRQLPYLCDLVSNLFEMDAVRYARIARLTPGSVLIPHRDYLELHDNLIRIHVPLETDDACVNSDEQTIYHMNVGEVWYLNATRIHSALSGWDRDRTHLVIDFEADSLADCFTGDTAAPAIPVERMLPRRPKDIQALRAFERAGAVMDSHNYRDFLKIAIKMLFGSELAPNEVFDLWENAAQHSPDPEMVDIATKARTYFLLDRA